jgi:hypothetical protein
VIAPCAGALWVGLTMAAAGEPSSAPATTTPAAATAPSTTSTVAVMRPPPGDTVLEEAGSRIRSELAAMGLEGKFVDCPPTETDGNGCPDAEASATISLARQDGVVEIAVRTILPDGLELRRHVRVLAHDGGDDPSVLAVRAVELLRDLRLTGQRPPPREPKPTGPARDDEEPKPPPPPPPPPVPPRWRLSTGVALLGSPAGTQPGVGPAFGLAIGASAIVGPSLTVGVGFAGPFDSTLGPIDMRSAALVQALVTLEFRFRLTLGPLEPFAAVLTGVNYLKATIPGGGVAVAIDPSTTSAWVPLLGMGVGVAWSFRTRFYLCVEAAAFVTQPDMLVSIEHADLVSSTVVGRTGLPSILISSSAGLILP